MAFTENTSSAVKYGKGNDRLSSSVKRSLHGKLFKVQRSELGIAAPLYELFGLYKQLEPVSSMKQLINDGGHYAQTLLSVLLAGKLIQGMN